MIFEEQPPQQVNYQQSWLSKNSNENQMKEERKEAILKERRDENQIKEEQQEV